MHTYNSFRIESSNLNIIYRFTDDGRTPSEPPTGGVSFLVRRPRPVSLGSLARRTIARRLSSPAPVQQMYGFSFLVK